MKVSISLGFPPTNVSLSVKTPKENLSCASPPEVRNPILLFNQAVHLFEDHPCVEIAL